MNDDTFSYLNLNNNISDMFFEEDSTIFICIYNISFVKKDNVSTPENQIITSFTI